MKWPGVRSYPTYLMIKGEPWDIKFVRKIPDGEKAKNATLGLCDPGDKCIYIKLKEPPNETFKTLVHEVLHAIEDEYCISVPHAVIYKFEEAIHDVLIENLDLVGELVFRMLSTSKR